MADRMTDPRYIDRVKRISCRLCARLGKPALDESDAHHPRVGVGGAERQHDYLAIALCKDCHQGTNGVHGNKSYLRIAKVDELDLVADTIKALSKG